ncbi:unnamed protein product, partial [Mesorhabditis belari]|uniref:Hydrophobin n=1 Tax=Mesorhabditis belari TaxID=2138241 RepID=A0AAF3J8G3_9BILA
MLSRLIALIALLNFADAQLVNPYNGAQPGQIGGNPLTQNGIPCYGQLQCSLGQVCCGPLQLPSLSSLLSPSTTLQQQQIGTCQSLYCPLGQVPRLCTAGATPNSIDCTVVAPNGDFLTVTVMTT